MHCLHGTFQAPGVWSGFEARLAEHGDIGDTVHVVAEEIDPPDTGGACTWAAGLCRRVGTPSGAAESHVLLGYSLGGRLAMHALVRCPRTWSAAVLVAAHPGGGTDAERVAVHRRDAAWAERCRRDRWEDLLAAWDGLPVFGGRPNHAPRPPGGFDRERCARTFEAFSRGGQADLRPRLAATRLPPILYVTGADDALYGALGTELAELTPAIAHVVVADAGHRVPWDQPDEFATAVGRFLRDVLLP